MLRADSGNSHLTLGRNSPDIGNRVVQAFNLERKCCVRRRKPSVRRRPLLFAALVLAAVIPRTIVPGSPRPGRAFVQPLAAAQRLSQPQAPQNVRAPLHLTVAVRARTVAPGEPLRILVRAGEPLSELGGSFQDEPVFFTPVAGGETALPTPAGSGTVRTRGWTVWSGWAAVDLDQKPGRVGIEVYGRTKSGRPAAGTLAVRVERRTFPTQRLDVEEKFVTPPPEVQARIEEETRRLAAVYAVRRAAPPPERPFVRPVPAEPTGVFGTRRVFNGKPRSPHPGLDLKAATGTPVRCSGPGLVTLAQELWFSGNTVIVDHGGGLFTIYAHLSRIEVKEGARLDAGDLVGLSGATGRVTGPHLHWGAKIGDRPFDPRALLEPRLFK